MARRHSLGGGFHSLPMPPLSFLLNLIYSGYVLDVSIGAETPIVTCFLHLDRLCISVTVSAATERHFFKEERELQLSVIISIWNIARNYLCLEKWK